MIGGVIVSLGLSASPAEAAGLPLVISATVNYSQKTLSISGQNFGGSPSVTVNSMAFGTLSSASNQIVAKFPDAAPPASFVPGTYFLTIQSKNQLPAIFTVDIGANGAPGPAGLQGAAGPAGAAGAPGPAGPAGPQGLAGSMGPTGATGAVGATGAAGPTGLAGPAGPKGDPGAPGTGAGIPTCSAPNPYLVISEGTLACQPQYVDNGDGTVTDNRTALMWEKKTGTEFVPAVGDVHDVNNFYTWTAASPFDATGTLFTDFLQQLNGLSSTTAIGTCFAGHCDWRIPSIGEQRSLLAAPFPCGGGNPQCIDQAIFGPTKPTMYWSSSSMAGNPSGTWGIYFGSGFVGSASKSDGYFARAVRDVR